MNDEIRKRIESIKRGEVPEGYKRTKVGIIPEDWDEITLDSLVTFQNGINAEKDKFGTGRKIIGVSDILNDYPIVYEKIKGMINIEEEVLERYSVTYGDILFQRSSENVEDVGKSNVYMDKDNVATFGGFVIRGKKKSEYNPLIINEILKLTYVRHQMMSKAAGAQHINVGQESLKKVKIASPNDDEQTKIVQIIMKMDEQRELLEKLVVQKKEQKRWLIQSICSGNKVKADNSNRWRPVKLANCINEINKKTTINNQFEILSVTKRGIVKQNEQFNRQIASQNNIGYKIVERGNLVFSTMNLWMGSLDVLKGYDIGIVSPAYKVFSFNKKYMIPEFGDYFMKTSYMIWVYNSSSEQGASIVRKNLDLHMLLNTKVSIPDIPEQQAIARILKQADKEIQLLQQKLDLVKQEKKAIMQLLLTGIVRVK